MVQSSLWLHAYATNDTKIILFRSITSINDSILLQNDDNFTWMMF